MGGMTYRYTPSVAHEDGGRPWVRERSHKSSKEISLEPSLSELAGAKSIVASGTESLGGTQVSRFVATFPAGAYPERNLFLGELLGAECPQPVTVELAIAPTGLPVEVGVSTVYYAKSGKKLSSSTTTRILATNFHLATGQTAAREEDDRGGRSAACEPPKRPKGCRDPPRTTTPITRLCNKLVTLVSTACEG